MASVQQQEKKDNNNVSATNTNTQTKAMKAIDRVNENISNGDRFFSFEYYPPKTDRGVSNLKKALKNMVRWGPQWMDVTWGAGGVTSDLTPEICDFIQNTANGNCMMHLTCTNMPTEKVDIALKQAKEMGFKNILALRGDPPEGQKEWKKIAGGFECALDLIKYIKIKYGDYFGITVSGYPEGHPIVRKKIIDDKWDCNTNKNPTYWAPKQLDDGSWEGVSPDDWLKELKYLKSKIDAGGQVIITQLFYDAQIFIEFVKAAREIGITAPILPGIMPIRNYGLFNRMTGFCKTVIPAQLKENLFKLKDDTDALYEYGMDYMHKLCEKILATKDDDGNYICPGLHLYTMNQEKPTIQLLEKCKIGFEKNEKLALLIDNELKRVLEEDKIKKLEKQKKEKEKEKNAKIELETNAKAVSQQEFKPVQTF